MVAVMINRTKACGFCPRRGLRPRERHIDWVVFVAWTWRTLASQAVHLPDHLLLKTALAPQGRSARGGVNASIGWTTPPRRPTARGAIVRTASNQMRVRRRSVVTVGVGNDLSEFVAEFFKFGWISEIDSVLTDHRFYV